MPRWVFLNVCIEFQLSIHVIVRLVLMNFKNSILKEGYYTILPLGLPLEQEPTYYFTN